MSSPVYTETTYRVPTTACPSCANTLETATGGPTAPRDGSIVLCLKCTVPLIFDADLALRILTEEDQAALDAETLDAINEGRALLVRFHAQRGSSIATEAS